MSDKHSVRHDFKENRIYLKRREKGLVERKIQVFSLQKQFPFLFAGTVNLSSEYEVWIAPASGEDLPSWEQGFGIRIIDEAKIEDEIFVDLSVSKTRVLFVTPHLSTGGCPQYLLKKIETYRSVLDIYVVEHDFLSPTYVVQRNKIIDLVGSDNFFSLGEDKSEILSIIKTVNPEIIHFEEMPESYVPMHIIDQIYSQERKYFITETTHSSDSSPSNKRFLPDKFIFCSKYSQEKFKEIELPSEVWEYPIENNKRPARTSALQKLGMDPNYFHVLNVGLFTPGKNQGEIFEIARKLESENVMFHFVGNQAGNFEHYWRPLMENVPSNCVIWGERSDVEDFMKACDVFYFSSVYELNPLVVKEALSWKMPVMMYNLNTYMGAYDDNSSITFLDPNRSLERNMSLLRKRIEDIGSLEFWMPRTKIVHIVSEIFSEIEQNSIRSVSSLAKISSNVEYTLHFNPPAKEIPVDRSPLFFNQSLKPGHFGCFEAFRKAITEDFTDDYDLLVVCERDCVLEKNPEEILALLSKTYSLMNRESVTYFSFGDTVDLDHGYLQSEKISDLPGNFAFLTGKIIGLQFIIFNRKGRDFLREQFNKKGWYGMDIWLNEIYGQNQMKMGILNRRATTQLDGFSLIDNIEKTFAANK